jgi:hypothetical protein
VFEYRDYASRFVMGLSSAALSTTAAVDSSACGVVNLLVRWLLEGVVVSGDGPGSGRCGRGGGAGDLVPGFEAVVHFGAVFGGGE